MQRVLGAALRRDGRSPRDLSVSHPRCTDAERAQHHGDNSDGHTAADLARQPDVQAFLDDASSLAPCPSRLHCIGADGCSLGIAWAQEPASEDPLVADVLAPLWYELEYCEKPSGLRRTSALMAMLMLSSSAAAAAATSSASSYLLNWTRLDVLLAPDASEYWLAGLESDREYLVRMRTCNRNGVSDFSVPTLSGEFTTTAACDRTASARVVRGLIAAMGPCDAPETSFIGTMTLEILEARRLQFLTSAYSSSSSSSTSSSAVRHGGRFYCALTVDVPVATVKGSPLKPRRTSMSNRRRSVQQDALRRRRCGRCIACAPQAGHSEDLLLSGNLNALRTSAFRVLQSASGVGGRRCHAAHRDLLRDTGCRRGLVRRSCRSRDDGARAGRSSQASLAGVASRRR
ncbi:hypothetical protein PINS_up019316 [Pythium insidiosum]|nr:hypothetical protein PINS_up019316 [Pythium insidiosum]